MSWTLRLSSMQLYRMDMVQIAFKTGLQASFATTYVSCSFHCNDIFSINQFLHDCLPKFYITRVGALAIKWEMKLGKCQNLFVWTTCFIKCSKHWEVWPKNWFSPLGIAWVCLSLKLKEGPAVDLENQRIDAKTFELKEAIAVKKGWKIVKYISLYTKNAVLKTIWEIKIPCVKDFF